MITTQGRWSQGKIDAVMARIKNELNSDEITGLISDLVDYKEGSVSLRAMFTIQTAVNRELDAGMRGI